MAYNKNHPETIQALFNSIAKPYDRTNAILSLFLHKRWNSELVRQVQSNQSFQSILDLCAGTGDIAFAYLKNLKVPCQAILVDFSSEMLACAKEKGKHWEDSIHTLQYVQADVQQLPFSDQSIDCATMAYGIRNVHHPLKCLQEVFRILRPGGCFGVLELTRPQNRLLKAGHQLYLKFLLPLLGKFLTTNENAYQYLQQSIHTFIPSSELENLIKVAGFSKTKRISLTGGVATIITGYKPRS